MGTNYYLYQKPDCESCGRPHESLHIGKSSGGWCFSLHVIPEKGIHTLEDWQKLWEQPQAIIKNEYGEIVSPKQMLEWITGRQGRAQWKGGWSFEPYYSSESEFHERNNSERGPNGLLRHRLGRYCVAHGEGTWDYITGEFS